MEFPRLSIEKQTEIAPIILNCLEGKPETHQDKLMMLILPLLGEIKIPQDPEKRDALLGLTDKPNTKASLLTLLMDVLLLPFGLTQEVEVPPGMSQYSFKRTYLEAAKTKFTKNGMNPSKITTTVGLNIGAIDLQGVRLSFWDLGGQEELQSLWDKYYEESHGLIYVIDSNDRERMNESKAVFDKMISNEYLSGMPLLVLANKQDLPQCMGTMEIKPVFQQAGHLIGRRDCLIMPVSALTGEGVEEGLRWLVESVKRNSIIRPPRNNE